MKIKIKILCLLSCFLFFVISMFNFGIHTINAFAETQYTDVLTDLSKDENFDINDYAVDTEDYSLKVIQIAESVNNELFVYVYQPCSPNNDLLATSINMSIDDEYDESNYDVYDLSLLSSSGTLYKYIVDDFIVSSQITRYYNVISIFRHWNSNYDESAVGDNNITYVAFEIGKMFILTNTADGVQVQCYDFETITVTSKYVGFVRYDGNTNFWGTSNKCDSHFIAFSTNKQIDRLLEASVFCHYNNVNLNKGYHTLTVYGNDGSTTSLSGNNACYTTTYSGYSRLVVNNNKVAELSYKPFEQKCELEYSQRGSYTSGHWTYSWNRIQSVDDFIQNEKTNNIFDNGLIKINQHNDLTDSAINELQYKQWVLRFFETSYVDHPDFNGGNCDQSIVYDVSILRLKFESCGLLYNLGTVDNQQNGSSIPSNTTTYTYSFSLLFSKILGLLLLILLLLVLWPILPYIFKFIFGIFAGIFKLIKKIFSKRDKKNITKTKRCRK